MAWLMCSQGGKKMYTREDIEKMEMVNATAVLPKSRCCKCGKDLLEPIIMVTNLGFHVALVCGDFHINMMLGGFENKAEAEAYKLEMLGRCPVCDPKTGMLKLEPGDECGVCGGVA